MATKGETNYYGIISTGHLRARRADVKFNTVFLGKIIDTKGASEVIENATIGKSGKEWNRHKRAMEAFQEEVASKKSKLDGVAKQVCDDLMSWREDHLSEWELLEEVAGAHLAGQKVLQTRKRDEEDKARAIRKADVEERVDALIACVRDGGSDSEIAKAKMRVMAAF